MSKNADSITLGLGDLSVDGADVGYLGGTVVFSAPMEFQDWDAGVPVTIRNRVLTGFKASLKASLAQLDLSALKLSLGIGTVSGQRLNLGTSWNLPTLNNVRFVHTRDDGRTVTIFFPKAKIEPGGFNLNFTAKDYIYHDITITAIYDSTSANCPLGYIEVT